MQSTRICSGNWNSSDSIHRCKLTQTFFSKLQVAFLMLAAQGVFSGF